MTRNAVVRARIDQADKTEAASVLAADKPLPRRNVDHQLTGEWKDHRLPPPAQATWMAPPRPFRLVWREFERIGFDPFKSDQVLAARGFDLAFMRPGLRILYGGRDLTATFAIGEGPQGEGAEPERDRP
jgi:hypothetical protein